MLEGDGTWQALKPALEGGPCRGELDGGIRPGPLLSQVWSRFLGIYYETWLGTEGTLVP
jgi:hypothetical protein